MFQIAYQSVRAELRSCNQNACGANYGNNLHFRATRKYLKTGIIMHVKYFK